MDVIKQYILKRIDELQKERESVSDMAAAGERAIARRAEIDTEVAELSAGWAAIEDQLSE